MTTAGLQAVVQLLKSGAMNGMMMHNPDPLAATVSERGEDRSLALRLRVGCRKGPSPCRSLWSRKLAAPPRGLALARERGWLLVWDAEHGLHLFNRSGEPQARWQTADALTAACCADDGGSFAAVGAQGQVWMLAPDLSPRWERTLPQRGTAVALDPFGQYLAAADGRGGLTLYDRHGPDALARRQRPAAAPPRLHSRTPRPGSGRRLRACRLLRRRRERPVARRTGGAHRLAGGQRRRRGDRPGVFQRRPVLLFAGWSEAARLRRRGTVPPGGGVLRRRRLPDRRPGSCLHLRDAAGAVRGERALDGTPVGVALTALGDGAYVGTGGRTDSDAADGVGVGLCSLLVPKLPRFPNSPR